MQIPLTRPLKTNFEAELLDQVLSSGWLTQGPMVKQFEQMISERTKAKHVLATSNGTTALHLALLAEGVRPGDEVIVPSFTWIATANAVCMTGAIPVFADIDPHTYNITAKSIEEVITKRTKVVMPVHQFGLPCDLDSITEVCDRYHVTLIEDAACALGSLYKGFPVGRLGTACFSFHPRKIISTGEGGAVTTPNPEAFKRMARYRDHGRSINQSQPGIVFKQEFFPEVGYNYRLSDLNGAVGVSQMKFLDFILERRSHLASIYNDELSQQPGIIPPHVPKNMQPNWQSYVVHIEGGATRRDVLAQQLLKAGISCRTGSMMCHAQPCYSSSPRGKLHGTQQAYENTLTLPLYPQMTEEEQIFVIDTIQKTLNKIFTSNSIGTNI